MRVHVECVFCHLPKSPSNLSRGGGWYLIYLRIKLRQWQRRINFKVTIIPPTVLSISFKFHLPLQRHPSSNWVSLFIHPPTIHTFIIIIIIILVGWMDLINLCAVRVLPILSQLNNIIFRGPCGDNSTILIRQWDQNHKNNNNRIQPNPDSGQSAGPVLCPPPATHTIEYYSSTICIGQANIFLSLPVSKYWWIWNVICFCYAENWH